MVRAAINPVVKGRTDNRIAAVIAIQLKRDGFCVSPLASMCHPDAPALMISLSPAARRKSFNTIAIADSTPFHFTST